MRRIGLFLLLWLALPSTASATWSVIAADRGTGRVVIASATCVDRDDQFLMDVQAVVVPGIGVAACQAGVDNTHQNQMLVFRELQKGTEPTAIIELPLTPPLPPRQGRVRRPLQAPLIPSSRIDERKAALAQRNQFRRKELALQFEACLPPND
jgi:hypothetical protein